MEVRKAKQEVEVAGGSKLKQKAKIVVEVALQRVTPKHEALR